MTGDWNPEPLTLESHRGGAVTVDHWPRHTEADQALIALADPAALCVDGNELTVTVTNGRAVYHCEQDAHRPVWRCHLLSSRRHNLTPVW